VALIASVSHNSLSTTSLLSFPIVRRSEASWLYQQCSVLGMCRSHGGWGSTLTGSGHAAPLPSLSRCIFAPLSAQIGAHGIAWGYFAFWHRCPLCWASFLGLPAQRDVELCCSVPVPGRASVAGRGRWCWGCSLQSLLLKSILSTKIRLSLEEESV